MSASLHKHRQENKRHIKKISWCICILFSVLQSFDKINLKYLSLLIWLSFGEPTARREIFFAGVRLALRCMRGNRTNHGTLCYATVITMYFKCWDTISNWSNLIQKRPRGRVLLRQASDLGIAGSNTAEGEVLSEGGKIIFISLFHKYHICTWNVATPWLVTVTVKALLSDKHFSTQGRGFELKMPETECVSLQKSPTKSPFLSSWYDWITAEKVVHRYAIHHHWYCIIP